MSTKQSKKLTFMEKFCYGLGDCSANIVVALTGTFLSAYYTDTVGIATAAVGMWLLRLRRNSEGSPSVLVPGINDDLAALQRTRAFLNTLSNVEQVDILPYHTMGIYKWEELGYTYTFRNVDPPDEETIRRAREILIEGGGCEFDREACLKQRNTRKGIN